MTQKRIKSKVQKLRFGAIIKEFREEFSKIEDSRRMPEYPIEDIIMSVFAMMFFQDPSLLQFQKRMKEERNINNLESLFGVKNIPSDGTIRNVLDKVDSDILQKVSFIIFSHLQRSGKLKEFINLDKSYLIALDATQFFTSNSCSCGKCLTVKKKGQAIRYYHNAIQATLIDPEQKFIIPLLAEEIVNTDSTDKQDSEHKAAKRLLVKLRNKLPKLKIIILGDDLYSHEPMIELLKKLKMSFILTAKFTSHKEMREFLDSEKEFVKTVTSETTINISKKTRLKQLKKIGKTKEDLGEPEVKKRYYKQVEVSEYKYYNGDVPINANYKTFVNYFELKTYEDLTKGTLFFSSWVTDLDISKNNIKKLVKAGRGRWNIENRQFLTTKKGGYELEHNYGHGKENLSFNFYVLNVLAFLVHQILHITSEDFNKFKELIGSYSGMYDYMKSTLMLIVFKSFDEIILLKLNGNNTS